MDYLQANPALLAVVIFFVRVTDVSLGTLRTILIFRGYRVYAPIIAFFEVLLWVFAVAQVIQHMHTWYLAVAYAGGFAMGNYVGMWIDIKLALGSELVRAIAPNPRRPLVDHLRERDYDVTTVPGKRADGEDIEIVLVVETRRRVPGLLQAIYECDPDAVWTRTDVRAASSKRRPAFGDLATPGKRK